MMTIRENCAQRARSVRRLAVVLGVIFLLSGSLYVTIAKLQVNIWYSVGAVGLLIFIIMHVGMTRIHCPRCATSLRRVAYNELQPVLVLTNCPKCNVSLDAPMTPLTAA